MKTTSILKVFAAVLAVVTFGASSALAAWGGSLLAERKLRQAYPVALVFASRAQAPLPEGVTVDALNEALQVALEEMEATPLADIPVEFGNLHSAARKAVAGVLFEWFELDSRNGSCAHDEVGQSHNKCRVVALDGPGQVIELSRGIELWQLQEAVCHELLHQADLHAAHGTGYTDRQHSIAALWDLYDVDSKGRRTYPWRGPNGEKSYIKRCIDRLEEWRQRELIRKAAEL